MRVVAGAMVLFAALLSGCRPPHDAGARTDPFSGTFRDRDGSSVVMLEQHGHEVSGVSRDAALTLTLRGTVRGDTVTGVASAAGSPHSLGFVATLHGDRLTFSIEGETHDFDRVVDRPAEAHGAVAAQ